MSRRDGGHLYQVSDNFWKVNIMIIAYMVPPYGIKWERRRIFFLDIGKGFPSGYANNVPA